MNSDEVGRMLRITKEADYGIMLLAYMAERSRDEIHAAREVATRCGLPLPMVSKILRALARENILTSHRGVGGGYRLVRAPESTSVAEVIRALEGPISVVQCGSAPGVCDQEPVCPTRINWARINREVEKVLERVPISAMIKGGGSPLLSLEDSRTPPSGAPH